MTDPITETQGRIDEFVGAAHGDLETVKKLLFEHPGLLQSESSWGETALQAAAQTRQEAIARLLLEAGAPLDLPTAAAFGRMAGAQAMLQEDPGLVHQPGAHGFPILYFAAIAGDQEMAQLLSEYGAEINAGYGLMTPLHGAVLFDQLEMARWLVSRGASLKAPDSEGRTPVELARELNREEILKVLVANPSP